MDITEFVDVMNTEYYNSGSYTSIKNPEEKDISGNSHVINGTYFTILMKGYYNNSLVKMVHKGEAVEFIESSQDRNIPGLFNRTPKKLEHEAHDDYIGIIATSKALGLKYSKDIYEYGNQWRFPKWKGIPIPVKWYYDNTEESPEFDIRCLFGRFFWTTSVIKAGAGVKLNLIDKLAYSGYLLSTVWFNKDRYNTSGKLLRWLTLDIMKGQSKITDYAIKKYEQYIEKIYTGKIGGVMGIYYGLDHPFSKYMWEKL